MKKIQKFLFAAISVLFALSIAAESFAETTVGGSIDIRGRWRENNNDLNKDEYGSTAFWEQRVTLWVDAKIAEGLKGYIELQSGRGTSDGFVTWGTARTSTDSAPNSMFNENRGLGYMEIRYAYIDFMIPKTPIGIKIGHFPVVLGHSIWADTSYWGSDGLMLSSSPTKELTVGFGTFKVKETGSNTDRSDIDMYTLFANYTFMPKNTAGFNASYLLKTGDANNASSLTTYAADMKLWNIMLTADGSFDFGLSYKFEIDKQLGKAQDTELSTSADIKGSGLAFLIGASYGIGEIAEVKFNAAYGSGDKYDTANKNEGYINFNNYGYTMIYEDIVGQKILSGGVYTLGNTSNTGAADGTDFGLYNTMYINVGAGVTPLKNMSVGLDIYYLRAVQANYAGQKKNLGWEFDLNFGYQIYKNLKWTLLAGYFLPGNHYKAVNSSDTVKDDAAWAFEQVLSLSF